MTTNDNNQPTSVISDREVIDPSDLRAEAEPATAQPADTAQEVEVDSGSAVPVPEVDEGKPLQSYFLAKRQNVAPVDHTSSTAFDPRTEIVPLPSTFGQAIDEAIAKMSALSQDDNSLWVEVLQRGRGMGYLGDEVVPALSRPGSFWTHAPHPEGGGPLTGASLALEAGKGKALSGERAVLTALSHFKMGTLFRAPLWSSGIWITVKAPGEARLVEFARQMVSNKISMGRMTYGMSFSNHMVYTAELFAELLAECEYNSTANEKVDLMEVISVQDFMTIVWALACAIYPNGFNYRRSCVNSPDKCNHVVEERINVARMLRVNQKAFTQEQLVFMGNKKNRSVSLEEIKKYQAGFAANFNHEKTLTSHRTGQKMKVLFKVPTLREFIDTGDKWATSISAAVLEALGADADFDKRNSYMQDLAKVSSSRQYLHWVDHIVIDTDPITDRTAIEEIFTSVVSADDDLREQFEEAVTEFQNATTVSVVGIPNYRCPSCKGIQHRTEGAQEDEDVPAIIPVEAVSTFFDLIFQKVSLIRQRV